MNLKTSVLSGLHWYVALLFLFLQTTVAGQTIVYADEISSNRHVDNAANALGNLSDKAVIRAGSGIIIGIGSYSGHLELRFTGGVPANTTTYIKIDADDNLFPILLGGSLGNLLSGVLGAVLIGNQEFTVQALQGTNGLIRGNSEVENDFASDRLRIVVNANNEYFIAVTPDKAYDRIRLTNRLGSLVGLGNTKRLGVYGAYYVSAPDNCGTASFTSYNGNGINLDALNIGGVGVSNPHHVLDNDPNSFSRLSMGILSVAGSIQQRVYFEGASHSTDNFNLRLKVDPSLLTLGVANNIRIIAHNGTILVKDVSLSSLLNLDLLTLLQGNAVASVPFSPGAPVTNITVKYSALLNVNLTQSLDLYGIVRTPALPTIDMESRNKVVCIGDTADLVARTDSPDVELRWYDALEGGGLLATVASGAPFTTPNINADMVFYVASARSSCPEESARVPVKVTAVQIPTALDISVTGNENALCNSGVVVLLPSSAVPGNFEWYLNGNKTGPITNGQIINGATHHIDPHGILTISGLTHLNSPYTYFVGMVFDSGCGNAAGDLRQVAVTVVDNNLVPVIALDVDISADDRINAVEASGMIPIKGTVSGNAQAGDSVYLIVNEVVYAGTVAADLRFNIPVNGLDLVADGDSTIEAFVEIDNGTCISVGNDTEGYLVDILDPKAPTVNPQSTNDTTPVITGTADSVDQLTVTVNGVVYTEGDGDLVDNGDNTWTLIIPDGDLLPEGIYDVVAMATDISGNTAQDITIDELEIDVTLVLPTVDPQNTESNTPVITGTAESADNLTVEVNGAVYTEGDGSLVDHGDDTWTLIIPQENALAPGTYDVVATVMDAAGNIRSDNTTNELVITAPLSDLVISKTVDRPNPFVGENVTFTIEVRNIGATNFGHVVVAEQLKSGFTYVGSTVSHGQYDAVTGYWYISDLLADQAATMTLQAQVGPNGDLTNTVTIESSGPKDLDGDNNTAEVGVELNCLTVFNEFTPNNDGANDFFRIECIEKYPNSTLHIYNRYGSLVYKSHGYKNDWQGYANVGGVVNKGEQLPDGNYFYLLKIEGSGTEKTGWIYLAR